MKESIKLLKDQISLIYELIDNDYTTTDYERELLDKIPHYEKAIRHLEKLDLVCDVCGKPVKWGVDGCPVVKKGEEMRVLFGNVDVYRHYKC